MLPLDAYRKAQAALRREFDALTAELCPTCPEPCCRVPARVTPLDAALAEACGWQPSGETGVSDSVATAASQALEALRPSGQAPEVEAAQCPFLTARGCDFPGDLRPYGCVTFVCRFMRERLNARSRARLRRLLAALETEHQRVISSFARRRGRSGRSAL